MDISLRALRPEAADETSVALYRPAVSDAVGLACTGYGMQNIRRAVRDRTLPCFAAVFVDKGNGWLEIGPARERITAPALFWVVPRVRHGYGPDEGTAWHEHWVLFEGPLADAFVATGLIDPAHWVTTPSAPAEIAALFGRIHSDFLDDGVLWAAAAAADLHRLAVTSARLAAASAATRHPAGQIEAALSALRDRAFEVVDLAALAREFGLSPATLRRQVQSALGVSPKAYMQRLRMARAKEMLAVSALSIEEVARASGHEDPYYFSRVFAGLEGMAPTEFRHRNQRG